MTRTDVQDYLYLGQYRGITGYDYEPLGNPLAPKTLGMIIRRGRRAGKDSDTIRDELRTAEEMIWTERQAAMFVRISRGKTAVTSEDYAAARDRLLGRGIPEKPAEMDTDLRLEMAKDLRTAYQHVRAAEEAKCE